MSSPAAESEGKGKAEEQQAQASGLPEFDPDDDLIVRINRFLIPKLRRIWQILTMRS
jgi:hypothetical protein